MLQILLTFVAALLCVGLSGGINDMFIKPYVGRLRPYDNPAVCWQVQLARGYIASSFGFFSSHAANMFSIATFTSLLVRSRLLTTVFFAWATLGAYTRLYLGVHYPTDVGVGILWGIVTGIMVYLVYTWVYNKLGTKPALISDRYTSTGYLQDGTDLVTAVFLFILAFAVIASVILPHAY